MIRIMKASAGSGKTYNLAKTYISLLLSNEDRYAYRHILAVTFTNKATEEMKSRIIKELHILATDPASSDYHDDFIPSLLPDDVSMSRRASNILRDILHDYSAFAVSTIDKFFQQTLKAFSREIGHFTSYQLELDKESLVKESVDRILDSLTPSDSGLLSWLSMNMIEKIESGGKYSPDANLSSLALRLMDPQRREEFERAGLDDEATYSQSNLEEIRKHCRVIIETFRRKVRDAAVASLTILRAKKVDPKDSFKSFMKALLAYEDIKVDDYYNPLDPPTAFFLSKAQDPDGWFSAAKKSLMAGLCPDLQIALADFCKPFTTNEYMVYRTALILDRQVYGLGVARELSETFKELMKEKNVLCIDDSNVILKGIIDNTEAPFVYEKLGVRFDHFLLDEFQDTASVQWDNFRPLILESDSKGKENLIVGDVKQSIYRWRGSDWKLLDSVIPSEFPGFRQEVLDTNYRSLSNIVEFNNEYFKSASWLLDKINDGGSYMTSIYTDVRQEVAKKDKAPGSVSLTFCDKDDHHKKILEAIAEVRKAGARLSEIAILVRKNTIGQKIAATLIENGIAVITDDSLNVKRSVTVRRLVSMMSLIDNPSDTVGSYLAQSLDIDVPGGCNSLVDMAEALIRDMRENDHEGVMEGEFLHLQSFMDNLHAYVSSNGNNLRGFLKYWEDADPSISSPSSGESVRVMTIHKSKGLDFPYVIIPFANEIDMFKSAHRWCAPDLKGTPLQNVAEGVYNVQLSKKITPQTMFKEHFEEEKVLQTVDNINLIYVAMTRAALGMHIIAEKPKASWEDELKGEENEGWNPGFADFAQVLFWFVASGRMKGVRRLDGETYTRFDLGNIVDFNALRKSEKSVAMPFPITGGDPYPSYPLNPEASEDGDVRERGRLKFSADSLDFFSEDGTAGVEASNRIRGVVLHDILAHVRVPGDLDAALENARVSGDLTAEQVLEAKEFLSGRLAEAILLGWFPEDASKVLLETDIIDTDGQIYRPDRVVIEGDKVLVIDYKFGVHHSKYESQMKRYADIWRRMGYPEVTAVLWYVQTGEYKVI